MDISMDIHIHGNPELDTCVTEEVRCGFPKLQRSTATTNKYVKFIAYGTDHNQ